MPADNSRSTSVSPRPNRPEGPESGRAESGRTESGHSQAKGNSSDRTEPYALVRRTREPEKADGGETDDRATTRPLAGDPDVDVDLDATVEPKVTFAAQDWLDPKTVAIGAAAVASVCLVLTIAALTIAVGARSDVRAANESRMEAATSLRNASELLDTMSRATLDVNVDVDQRVPINASVPIEETFLLPIKAEVPVQQNVQATARTNGFWGPQDTNVTIPLDILVPIDTEVPFSFDRPVDLSTDIVVQAEVPVAVDLAETELGPLAGELSDSMLVMAESIESEQE